MNFRLTLTLATPFVLSAPLTLDALLAAAVSNATGLAGEDTVPHIPLEQEDGIFRGSSLFCHPRYRHVAVGRVMSLKTEHDLSVDLFHPNGRRHVFVDQKRGRHKANMSAYGGIESPEVYFYGVGDGNRAAHLIRSFVLGIGKRCQGGAGEVLAVTVSEIPEDRSWRTAKGAPARPLPIAMWESLGGGEAPTMPMAVRVPYWRTPKVDAVFPATLVA